MVPFTGIRLYLTLPHPPKFERSYENKYYNMFFILNSPVSHWNNNWHTHKLKYEIIQVMDHFFFKSTGSIIDWPQVYWILNIKIMNRLPTYFSNIFKDIQRRQHTVWLYHTMLSFPRKRSERMLLYRFGLFLVKSAL